eukprot:TRINITY_DN3034_c0_g1_i1.p1 TRINITY_DN3034_c0_g1~~TRINITY_DN3034_c0_g1_i1.p1  ORF type:complete len:151 (-),score=16.81 TRINITY_DN3034_c0_g1_i1:18-470(-)
MFQRIALNKTLIGNVSQLPTFQTRNYHRLYKRGCGVLLKLPNHYRTPKQPRKERHMNAYTSVNKILLEIIAKRNLDFTHPVVHEWHKRLFDHRFFVIGKLIDVVQTDLWREFPDDFMKKEIERYVKIGEENKSKWDDWLQDTLVDKGHWD